MKYALIILACLAASYAAFAFIFSDIDPREWGAYFRFICLVVGAFSAATIIAQEKL